MSNETQEYILSTLNMMVWSGLHTREEIHAAIEEMIEDEGDPDVDAKLLLGSINSEFARKKLAEADWPAETDCDRLDRVFSVLNASGIVSLQNAGYTMSDGLSDVFEEKCRLDDSEVIGYCFYHGQDLERAVSGDGIMVAFGAWETDTEKQLHVGNKVKHAFEQAGFAVEWDGTTEQRINIPQLDWKRRFSA